MGRFRGSITKLSRREGINLAETEKVQKYLDRRPYAPGQHGQRRGRGRPSDYSVRLREKQKLARLYGVNEKQFRNLFEEAANVPGVTGTVFLQLLERRLDNVVFRMGFASTRRQARQFVGHGHVLVNGKKVDIASYRVRVGDEISVSDKSRQMGFIQENMEAQKRRRTSPWIELNPDTFTGTFVRLPAREDLALPINENFIIEYYSR
ncbi:30S ribosomal protein S4 [Deinococcus metallilatus]|uniref:Small ribosomal subunit protein uS4 n=1 Tax=Deinococcus metallilatus TaxID=1211322 RepID=A0AAJ5JX71_9DEIO|nr:30S ribosomal protein S4 [Deinococcus metallilatus]MBB5296879.1 small subunit ribosomal protein S4 [Deinococcus metallilatus]QBY09611.1 30S ribosomal protein S4 [Deinococcus metallilatus]RXJ09102.1 30S ribosomal protein S4 [Deinococcus metallilatus]TLK20887.1 30S ribosomal protein S4 [Deinococcus metallilatus]GMA13913.1 30S ribosomal protein S4 [Deinococcus metallilatus]